MPSKPNASPSEQEIKKVVIEWLSYQKNLLVMPKDSVGIFDPIRKTFRKRHGTAANHRNVWVTGVSDILVISPKFGFLAIELKSKTGKLSPDQMDYLDAVTKIGFHTLVARDLGAVVQKLAVLGHV